MDVEGEEFSLKWDYHQPTIVTTFDSLLNNGTFTDCTLAAEGKFIQAHRVILSACSPYFAAIFSQQFDKHPIVVLHGMKFEELSDIMCYMYKGEANVSTYDHLTALLKTAQSLQIKGLSEHASKSNEYDDDRHEDVTTNSELLKRQQPDVEPISDVVESGQDSISLEVNGEIHTQQDHNEFMESDHKKHAVTTYDEEKIALNVSGENYNTQQEESDSFYRPKSTRKRKPRSYVDERNQRSARIRNKATISKDVTAGSKRFLRSKSLCIQERSYETDCEEMGQYASTKLQDDESRYVVAEFREGVRQSNVLIYNGSTFSKNYAGQTRSYWRCTKYSKGCRARAFTKIINGNCMMSEKIEPKHNHE